MARDAAAGAGEKLQPAGHGSGRHATAERKNLMSKLTLQTDGDTHVVVTRRFAAPPEAVYRAHTDPEIIQKWMLGPEGWTMPVCISDAKPGGSIRYEWSNGKGGGFFLTGEYVELQPSAALFMWSGCTCPIPRPTITWKQDLTRMVRALS